MTDGRNATSRIIDLAGRAGAHRFREPDAGARRAGEAAIAAHLAGWLRRWPRLSVDVIEVAPGRPNVIARLHGLKQGPTLLLTTHLDTVGVEHMADPFSA